MPRGPKGEKHPADMIGNAVYVMRSDQGSRPARVEASIESYMEMVLHDWELYQSGKGKR